MRRILTLQKGFLRKNVKDILSFAVLLFFATVFLLSSLIINNNIDAAYEQKRQTLDAADGYFTISKVQYSEDLLQDIKNIAGVNKVEAQDGVWVTIPVLMEDSLQEQNVIFYNYDSEREINRFDVVEKDTDLGEGIYLANYTYIHAGLNLGDNFEFELDGKLYTYPIVGVIEEMQYGNYSASVIAEYLSNDLYEEMFDSETAGQVVTIAIKSDEAHRVYDEVSKYLSNAGVEVWSKNYAEQAKVQRLAIANILVLIIVTFAILLLLVSLLMSKFKITESIEEETANMGVLKALGYTSGAIMVAIIMPYLVVSLVVGLLGMVVAFYFVPVLAKVVEMQSGFIWRPEWDINTGLGVLVLNVGLVTVFAIWSAKRIRKLNPIDAIRGLDSGRVAKNHFEIDKTRGGVGLILTLKNFANGLKQNLLLGVVVFLITIVVGFVGTLFYNVNLYPDNFVNTLVEEHPSVVIATRDDLRDELKLYDGVSRAIYYDESQTANYGDDSYKTFVAESYTNLANDLCYEGRNPKDANEIAVGSAIKAKAGLQIGDQIEVTKKEKTERYEVVGFVQTVNYAGEIFELTVEGYQRLDGGYEPNVIYVYLDDERRSEALIDDVKKEFGEDIISTVDYVKSMESASAMYVTLVSAICIVVLGITLVMVYLILHILITTMIWKQKQDLGILKAVGYQNRQLMLQLIGGLMPSVMMATILGIIANKLWMNEIYRVIFITVGAYKTSFSYPLGMFIILGIGIVVGTMLMGLLLTRRIKKISPYSLIKE